MPRGLHWQGWQSAVGILVTCGVMVGLTAAGVSLLLACGAGLAAMVTVRATMDMWPRKIPPELAGDVARLEAAGFRRLRRHPLLCTEHDPHVHFAMYAGHPVVPLVLSWRGRVEEEEPR